MQGQGRGGTHKLADDGGHGGTGGFQPGNAEQTEDEHRVQHDVGHRADELGGHGKGAAAGGHQDLFHHALHAAAQAEDGADGQILGAVAGNEGVGGLGVDERFGAEQTEDQKADGAAHRQKQAVGGGAVGFLMVSFAQVFGQIGVDAHRRTHRKGYQQVLDGEGQAHGGQGRFVDVGNEDAVHHVVQCLHQHRDHHGDSQRKQQGVQRFGAHTGGGNGFAHA